MLHGPISVENMETVLQFCMLKCNKSVMILPRDMVIQLYTILQRHQKPAYFGQDVVIETIWGYKYIGYLPTNIILKGRYLLQTGIVEWWQQYFDFSIVLKTTTHFIDSVFATIKSTEKFQSTNGKTTIAILLLIPGCGLLLSMLIFILFESRFWKVGSCYVLKLVQCIKCTRRIFQHRDSIWNDVVAIKIKPVELSRTDGL